MQRVDDPLRDLAHLLGPYHLEILAGALELGVAEHSVSLGAGESMDTPQAVRLQTADRARRAERTRSMGASSQGVAWPRCSSDLGRRARLATRAGWVLRFSGLWQSGAIGRCEYWSYGSPNVATIPVSAT